MAKQRRISDGFDTFTMVGISIVLVLAILYQRVPVGMRWLYVGACICAAGLGLSGVALLRAARRRRQEKEWRTAAATVAEREREQRRALAERIRESRRIRECSPLELEEFVAQLFSDRGYETRLTPVTGDHGIDIYMRNPKGEIELVQCKQLNRPVTEEEARDFAGAVWKERAVRGYFFAPGGFAYTVRQWVGNGRIELMDEVEILHMMDEAREERTFGVKQNQ